MLLATGSVGTVQRRDPKKRQKEAQLELPTFLCVSALFCLGSLLVVNDSAVMYRWNMEHVLNHLG